MPNTLDGPLQPGDRRALDMAGRAESGNIHFREVRTVVLGEVPVMSTSTITPSAASSRTGGSGHALATTGLVAGITGAVLTTLAAVSTFSLWLEATPFNGPLALVAFAGAPAALVSVVCGVLGLKSNGRDKALIGLVLSALTIGAWVAIIGMAPWPEP